jgi:molecular chaperone HtpG
MKQGQEAIYFLVGDNADTLSRSAQLEGFRARGLEVLLLTDSIDAFWPERMDEFDGKPMRSVTQGAADLSKLAPIEAPAGEAADVAALLTALKAALKDEVGEVRATDRLVDSAVVLAAGTAGPDLQMQRLLRRAGRTSFAAAPPVLEVNPRHKLVVTLAAKAAAGEDMSEAAGLLFDLARIQDGDLPRDPATFARRVEAALAGG